MLLASLPYPALEEGDLFALFIMLQSHFKLPAVSPDYIGVVNARIYDWPLLWQLGDCLFRYA